MPFGLLIRCDLRFKYKQQIYEKKTHKVNIILSNFYIQNIIHALFSICSFGCFLQKGKLSLTLSNVAGIFYILIVGLVLAIILGVTEFTCFRAKHKVKLNAWEINCFPYRQVIMTMMGRVIFVNSAVGLVFFFSNWRASLAFVSIHRSDLHFLLLKT